MSFVETSVEVKEDSKVSLAIKRSGDTSGQSSVICYTRQNTASVEEDFVERPLTELSRVVFHPGQTVSCPLFLIKLIALIT